MSPGHVMKLPLSIALQKVLMVGLPQHACSHCASSIFDLSALKIILALCCLLSSAMNNGAYLLFDSDDGR